MYNVRAMKVLIIEDDRETAQFVSRGLEHRGFTCRSTSRGGEGFELIARNSYDVAIVDIKLPDISGFELIRLIREKSITTPIIVLSSMNTPADKIAGLNCGADDYLGKPFARDELIARIFALVRRSTVVQKNYQLRVGDLSLSEELHAVRRGNRVITLTPGELNLLAFLMRNAGKTLPPAMIYRHLFGSDYLHSSKIVETRMCILRKKLCENGEPNMIFTIRGFGYVLR